MPLPEGRDKLTVCSVWRLQIAGALMLWLECLPEPLIPQRLYRPLLQAAREDDAEARRTTVQLLLRQVSSAPSLACPAGQAPLLRAICV